MAKYDFCTKCEKRQHVIIRKEFIDWVFKQEFTINSWEGIGDTFLVKMNFESKNFEYYVHPDNDKRGVSCSVTPKLDIDKKFIKTQHINNINHGNMDPEYDYKSIKEGILRNEGIKK